MVKHLLYNASLDGIFFKVGTWIYLSSGRSFFLLTSNPHVNHVHLCPEVFLVIDEGSL